MGKRSYRSVKVKQVDWERAEKSVRDDRMVFGVDIARRRSWER